MLDHPLALHITVGTYGTRLHGDIRGTVDRRHNQPGRPVLGWDERRRRAEAASLRYPPVVLSVEQRLHAQSILPAVCERGGWQHLNAAAQEDHLHVLLKGSPDGKAVRRWLKVWLGQELAKRWPLLPGQSWWAEGGSVKHIWNEDYLARAFDYIERQKTRG